MSNETKEVTFKTFPKSPYDAELQAWSDRNQALFGDDTRWDLIAASRATDRVKDVLLDGKSIKCVCSALSFQRGEALCYAHKYVDGKVQIIDPVTAEPGESADSYIATGKIEVTYHPTPAPKPAE